MRSKLIVSAVQMKILSAERNLPKILKYIERAAEANSDIVCFPEGSFNPNYKKPSFERDLKEVQEKCKKENIFTIINGYFKENNSKVYNRTYLINNKGEILGLYDKVYLWKNEINKVRRGISVKVFDSPLGKIGLSTCWDLFFPKIFEELKNKGAEIIFCPSYWWDNLKGKEAKFLENVPTVVASQYMCFFVFCNALFKGKNSVSQISAPWGELAKIKYREGIITAKLYYQRLKRFKNHFKTVFYDRKL